jgi:hypothetical protein
VEGRFSPDYVLDLERTLGRVVALMARIIAVDGGHGSYGYDSSIAIIERERALDYIADIRSDWTAEAEWKEAYDEHNQGSYEPEGISAAQILRTDIITALGILRDDMKHDELAREEADVVLAGALCPNCADGLELAPPDDIRHCVPGSDGAVRPCLAAKALRRAALEAVTVDGEGR